MAEEKPPDNKIKVYPPDRSLHAKIGHANLDNVLTAKVVESAEQTIQASSDEFWQESLGHLTEIGKAYKAISENSQNADKHLAVIADKAFAIKVSAGLGGYHLVSMLAKSLHKQCEGLKNKQLTPKNIEILKWHVDSIRQLLSGKIMGDGGMAGVSIGAALERLTTLK